MNTAKRVVAQFAIGHGRHIVARVYQFRGVTRLDLREWVDREGDGQLVPTKRGINVRGHLGEQLVAAAYALHAGAQTEGGTAISIPEHDSEAVDR